MTGWPIISMVRGTIVWNDGDILAKPGDGKFLRCELPATARPRGTSVHGFNPTSGDYIKF